MKFLSDCRQGFLSRFHPGASWIRFQSLFRDFVCLPGLLRTVPAKSLDHQSSSQHLCKVPSEISLSDFPGKFSNSFSRVVATFLPRISPENFSGINFKFLARILQKFLPKFLSKVFWKFLPEFPLNHFLKLFFRNVLVFLGIPSFLELFLLQYFSAFFSDSHQDFYECCSCCFIEYPRKYSEKNSEQELPEHLLNQRNPRRNTQRNPGTTFGKNSGKNAENNPGKISKRNLGTITARNRRNNSNRNIIKKFCRNFDGNSK